MTRIVLEQLKCVSSGQCVMAASSVFDQREEDGVAFLLRSDVGPELDEAVETAAYLCPGAAIEVSRAT